ncbi:uncharacterized protein B0T23DRAFT_448180 [Neurospora hispaniola]|uniref:Uncharacterized protein n=1 Tax=Neurospora hispaniola TaxID=588809 RepID=A0AAJ0I1D1_9PEZI|nr:hypothetical protein B0T23DRAFT_448180 [Neurospora hispaniola]
MSGLPRPRLGKNVRPRNAHHQRKSHFHAIKAVAVADPRHSSMAFEDFRREPPQRSARNSIIHVATDAPLLASDLQRFRRCASAFWDAMQARLVDDGLPTTLPGMLRASNFSRERYSRLGYRTIGDTDDDVGSVVAVGSPPGSGGGSPMQISSQSSPAPVAPSPEEGRYLHDVILSGIEVEWELSTAGLVEVFYD